MIKIFASLWCLFIVGWAFFTDVKYHKIKNNTVLIGMAGGLLLNIAHLKPALLGILMPTVFLVLFAVHMMGAGDIKLFYAIGGIMCFPDIVQIILYSFVFCGIHILIRAISQRGLWDLFQNLWYDLQFFLITRKVNKEHTEQKRLPMAGSIFLGVLLHITEQVLKLLDGGGYSG